MLRQGLGAIAAKVNLTSAFWMVLVCRDDWELLGFQWHGAFYANKCFPFSLRSTPFLFNQFALALHWILQHNCHIDAVQYLDDYFHVGPVVSP